MTRYIYRDGDFHHHETGEAMPIPLRSGLCAPMLIADLQPYRSPLDGREIGSRSAQREELRRNNLVLAEPRKKPRGFKNPHFAKKRGLPLNQE